MRCPYCGGLNTDQARFCARCGKDITKTPTLTQSPPPARPSYPPSQRPSYQPPEPPRPTQSFQDPGPRPPYGSSRAVQPVMPGRAPRSQPAAPSQAILATEKKGRRSNIAQSEPSGVVVAPVVEPPAAFPPRTMQQLQELEAEALEYTVLDESESYGRKKIVRIRYANCTGWQQVATLYKALKTYRSAQFDTIIIYGVSPEKFDKYNYTNGMVQFDQKVRLGSQVLNRYQIETENGFSSDAVRIVLNEE